MPVQPSAPYRQHTVFACDAAPARRTHVVDFCPLLVHGSTCVLLRIGVGNVMSDWTGEVPAKAAVPATGEEGNA
jgi:hypothetical protein